MIALYARGATEETNINDQVFMMERYCDMQGWTEYQSYIDAGVSGITTDRPSLNALMNDVKDRKIEKVLVLSLDRLSRSQKDTLMLIDHFTENEATFLSLREGFDSSSAMGQFMINVLKGWSA